MIENNSYMMKKEFQKAHELALEFKTYCLENNIPNNSIIDGVAFDVYSILRRKSNYRYEFRPVQDISVYELALIVAAMNDPKVYICDLPNNLLCHFNCIKVEDDER